MSEAIISRVKQRLMNGTLSKEQAAQVLGALKQQPAQQAEQQPEFNLESFDPGGDIGVSTDSPKEDVGIMDRIGEAFTGAKRQTKETETLSEIGSAPELNRLSVPAFKASLGLLSAGDTESLKGILNQQLGAKFRKDEKGNDIVSFDSGDYLLNAPGLSGQDITRGLAQFLAFTPAARAAMIPSTIGRRVAAGGVGSAATEAGLQQASKEAGGSDIDPAGVAIAGGLGAAGQGVGEVISSIGRASVGAIPQKAQQIISAGEELGVPVKTTDIIQPKGIVGGLARQLGERIPIFGTGGGRALQQTAREKAVAEFTDRVAPSTSGDIVASLKTKTSGIKKAAGNRLERVKDTLSDFGEAPRPALLNTIDESINRLRAVKIEPDNSTIQTLERIREGARQPHSFSELRDARTSIREIGDAVDPMGRSQMGSKSKAAVKAVERAITRDLDEFAKANLPEGQFQKYKQADAIWAGEATKMTKSRLKNVLDKGDITPETVETLLLSRKPSEVKLLYNSLGSSGRAAARGSIIQRALEKATRGDDISPTVFASELDRLRGSVVQFFKGGLLRATKRAQEAGVVTPTGQSLIGVTAVGAGAQVGLLQTLAGAATGGAAARIYESPLVRDLLLKVAAAPTNSTQFDKVLRAAMPAINAELNAIRRER